VFVDKLITEVFVFNVKYPCYFLRVIQFMLVIVFRLYVIYIYIYPFKGVYRWTIRVENGFPSGCFDPFFGFSFFLYFRKISKIVLFFFFMELICKEIIFSLLTIAIGTTLPGDIDHCSNGMHG
jgi:hypothetical protein